MMTMICPACLRQIPSTDQHPKDFTAWVCVLCAEPVVYSAGRLWPIPVDDPIRMDPRLIDLRCAHFAAGLDRAWADANNAHPSQG